MLMAKIADTLAALQPAMPYPLCKMWPEKGNLRKHHQLLQQTKRLVDMRPT